MGAACWPMGNRRIPVRSPAAAAPSASCTGEAPLLWSAVCSQTSMGGRPRGAKMTRGGGRRTSRAPTRAQSASATQGRQAPGRRPACDALDSDGDSARDSEEQPTGQTHDGRAGHRHAGDHGRAGPRPGSRARKAPRRLGTTARMPQRLAIRSWCSCSYLLVGVPHTPVHRWEASRLPSCVRLALSVLGAGLIGLHHGARATSLCRSGH